MRRSRFFGQSDKLKPTDGKERDSWETSAQFKAQVAMAALAGDKTLAELASECGVHPTMSSTWKQELVKNAKGLFERGNKKAAAPQAVSTTCTARSASSRSNGISWPDSPPLPAC